MSEERTYTRQEFFEFVWSTPMQQLARDFKLSDVGLAKACKRFNIPRPPRGHWQKAAVGKAETRPALPPSPNGLDEIRFYIPDDPERQPEPVMLPELAKWIDQEHDPKNKIRVPATVASYHPLVRKANDALDERDQNDQYGLRSSGRDTIPIRVAKQNIGRACRLLHALLSAFASHKWRLEIDREHQRAYVNTMGETVHISLDERTRRVEHRLTGDEERRKWKGDPIYPPKWDYEPIGELHLLLEFGYGHEATFQDRKDLPLEEQLNDVVLAIARACIEILKPNRLRREEEEKQRHEREQQRWRYQQQCERFDKAYHAWREHQERLRFVSVLEEAFGKLENPSEQLREYVEWMRRYVEAAVPLPVFFQALEEDKPAYYHDFKAGSRSYF